MILGKVAAATVAMAAVWLTFLTGGLGALLFAVATAALVAWWRVSRHDALPPWPVALGLVLGLLVWNGVSLARAAIPDNGDRLASRVADWGRDHGLGDAIDRLEAVIYAEPPSVAPAQELALATTTSAATTTTVAATTTAPNGTVPTTATPTTAEPKPAPPAALTPLFAPSLPGEGQWVPIASAGGDDAMWATSLRPLQNVGGVVATMVVVDQRHLRAALFNGSDEPGGTWARGNRVPNDLQPMLLAAMNGGFRFEHIKGGYVTEGVVVKPLRNGDATVAIDRNGRITMGKLGRDIIDDGSWASLRQNLELIVDQGKSNVQQAIRNGVWWGADHGNEVYVKRSAMCTLADGRFAYAMADPVNAEQLAQTLIAMGCVNGMQMDINVDWPAFLTYTHDGTRTRPQFVDTRMTGNARRFLDGSSKEFFAFFDATQVPAGSVLER